MQMCVSAMDFSIEEGFKIKYWKQKHFQGEKICLKCVQLFALCMIVSKLVKKQVKVYAKIILQKYSDTG